jgi:hypothetical protein
MTPRIVLSLASTLALAALAALAACGQVAADGPDAHVADPADAHLDGDGAVTTEPDAQADAQTTGVASVTVYGENGFTEPGVAVVFHHADGTVVQKLSTDAHGRASAIVDRGDLVSVARTSAQGARQVVTFVGVAPGDELRAGDPGFRASPTPYGTLIVSGIVYPGASSFGVDAGCYDSASLDESGVATLPLYDDGCHAPAATLPLYVQARDGLGNPLAYATRPALAGGGDGAVTLVASDWHTDFASSVISVVNTPTQQTVYPAVFVDNLPGREIFEFPTHVAGSPQPGENVNATVVLPRHLGTGFAHAVTEQLYSGNDQTIRLLAERHASGLPPTLLVDAGRFLPRLLGRALVGTGDAARPRLTWIGEAGLEDADGGVVHTSWYDAAAETSHEWILVVPPGATGVQLPALPESLAAWRPTADAAPDAPALYFVDTTAAGGYDAFRQRVGTYVYYQTARTLLPLLPAGEGELRVTSIDIAGS